MSLTYAASSFPRSRALLPATRLAFIHLPTLLSSAKRDREARVSGYVAVVLPDEVVVLYLHRCEAVTATVTALATGQSRAVPIAAAVDRVPVEAESGQVCLHEGADELLSMMYAVRATPGEEWPSWLDGADSPRLLEYLRLTTFDGFVEVVADGEANYLVFRNGEVVRSYLTRHEGVADRDVPALAALTRRMARGDVRVGHWEPPAPLEAQAPPSLFAAYQALAADVLARLEADGRGDAMALADAVCQAVVPAHPVLQGVGLPGHAARDVVATAPVLTEAVAAWLRELMRRGADPRHTPVEALVREVAWPRRQLYQSCGLLDLVPELRQ
jgi:hypothetical protein